MKSEDIEIAHDKYGTKAIEISSKGTTQVDVQHASDLSVLFWLTEVAYQLAVMNERESKKDTDRVNGTVA